MNKLKPITHCTIDIFCYLCQQERNDGGDDYEDEYEEYDEDEYELEKQ